MCDLDCWRSINVYSQIGLIALIGLITKHGILIVEFANKCLAKGMTIESATIEALNYDSVQL